MQKSHFLNQLTHSYRLNQYNNRFLIKSSHPLNLNREVINLLIYVFKSRTKNQEKQFKLVRNIIDDEDKDKKN